MKRHTLIGSVLAGVLVVVMLGAGERQDQWKKVTDAIDKGLPKTAIEELDPIIQAALKEGAHAEAIKAIATKVAMEGVVQGNKPEEKITRMKAAIAAAPAELRPVMEAVLANWYWHYFQQNRWRFLRRTATAEAPGEDFTTWDLPRIFAEIDKQFGKALAAADTLKKIPIAQYDDLLVKGNQPDSNRPTLYDFLAYNALEFYASGEQAAAKRQDAFELSADGPIFGPVAEFLAYQPQTPDEDSPTLKAVRLYQDLLRFHQPDEDTSALLDADLARLVFGFNKAFGEEKNARYKAALQRFVDAWGDHEISARARYHGAQVLHDEGDLVEARTLAQQGWNAFPNSVGGRQCYNLIQQIEAKSAAVQAERVWNEPWPTISVRYRNVTRVFFRAVPWDVEERLSGQAWHPENLEEAVRKQLVAKKPLREWSAELPATEDYQERVEDLPAPQDLPPGFYFLVASHDPSFAEANNQVSCTAFWVSRLALVVRSRQGDGFLEGFVLDALSGDPRPEARVRVWHRSNQNRWIEAKETLTDINGLFRLSAPQHANLVILASDKDQALSSSQPYSVWSGRRTGDPYQQTVFFTDRSLYRPGQTIQYKGICIRADQNRDDYQVLKSQPLTVVFADTNGQEVARQAVQTNDYGSFSGSFTAPRDRLMGRMYLRVDGTPRGQAVFNVEEYKRPKFQVTLDAPQVAARLAGDVSLGGTATAYTGAPVDGAQVRWRVVRQVQYPAWWYWRCWWMPPRPEASQEIAHGTAITGADGKFTIDFTARPDLSVAEKDEPIFRFSVSADVTDTAGETRSGQRVVSVGYTALQASLSADSWQAKDQPVKISVTTRTLDGEGQKADGVLKVYRLKQPEKTRRANLQPIYRPYRRSKGDDAAATPPPDPANPNSWPLGELVAEQGLTTDAEGNASAAVPLPAGIYRATLATQDPFGKPVTAELPLQVLDPQAPHLGIKIPQLFAAPKWTCEPGEEFTALWGSGYDTARAFVEIEHRGKILQSYWTAKDATQASIKQAVGEAQRGGFTVRVTMVRENRAYLESRRIDVPWTNKKLQIRWEHFVSKLQPGQKETWTAVISGPDAKRAVAEMVAALYDESLDAYLPHGWTSGFGVFRQDASNVHSAFENSLRDLQQILHGWRVDQKDASLTYRSFPPELVANVFWYGMFQEKGRTTTATGALYRSEGRQLEKAAAEMETDAAPANRRALKRAGDSDEQRKSFHGGDGTAQDGGGPPAPDLSQVAARQNLNETAFFFPHLVSDSDGVVKLEFTMPEALTRWKFLGFAHDAALRSGALQDSVVTAKDLMVQPNPPRFLREGDVLQFSVKVTNQSAARQTGAVRLTLSDARTGQAVDAALGNTQTDLAFDVPSKESRSFSWKLTVPDGQGFLTYKAVGSTGKLSDGEEGYLPVLSRRILVTESLPLPIRGPQTKEFTFSRLLESGQSDTLKHQSLTVQMVSNPSWYAVLALPYLMEYPYECSEQVFNRLYANSLARHIAGSDPKIRRVFDTWKAGGGDTFDSPLEKNQDLKAVMLEETPWVRQAQAESQARRNVGLLFDQNRLNDETARTLKKLAEMQRGDGLWPWFPGGPGNEYITLYITTGFGRLRHLGVDVPTEPAVQSLAALDAWIDRQYREILRGGQPEQNHLSSTVALYLYGRSFFLQDKPLAAGPKEAVDYFLGQARTYWLKLAARQSEAHLALALKRFGDLPSAQAIMKSLKERSVTDEELGRFWRDTELSWWWYRAPIETQAMMIEAFDEVLNDAVAVEECRVWLLKQKQTQDWKTTKATADAIYGLLLRGTDILASDALVEVRLGEQLIRPEQVEAGTGFFQERFAGGDIKPQFGAVTVKKTDPGVAWGSLHWQYLEDMRKVTPYEGTPLKLEKKVFVKRLTERGPVLEAVAGPLAVGDELVVRVVLRTDRDMEYAHLKDQRPSGTEPVNVLSQYKFQDGLYYYESTRDTASHFFIDYLPKGTYVFEYSVRVQHQGRYQTGMAQIQCLYAPEFNSHSESLLLQVD